MWKIIKKLIHKQAEEVRGNTLLPLVEFSLENEAQTKHYLINIIEK